MGFNLGQKTFICDNYLKSYARLNALSTENVNARNQVQSFHLLLLKVLPASKYCLFGVFKYIFHV